MYVQRQLLSLCSWSWMPLFLQPSTMTHPAPIIGWMMTQKQMSWRHALGFRV